MKSYGSVKMPPVLINCKNVFHEIKFLRRAKNSVKIRSYGHLGFPTQTNKKSALSKISRHFKKTRKLKNSQVYLKIDLNVTAVLF